MIPRLPKGFTHPMVIGEGAFSSVYRARQEALDRWVAIKILKEGDDAKRQVQLKEARTQARMQVGCVPQVFDAFEWHKQVCIVMQWVRGISLARILEGELNGRQRSWLAQGLVHAVAGLHMQGYAHRDLKPENILVSPNDGIYLVDFGFTKDILKNFESFSGTVKGTPAYMAPELWLSKGKIDYAKADLFSLGKVLKLILKDGASAAVVDPLLQENPDDRPVDGKELIRLWGQVSGFDQSAPDWQDVCGAATANELSRQLHGAAGRLIHVKREDEAYWLLAECLDEDPNHEGALELMARFSSGFKPVRRLRRMAIMGVVGACALIVVAFFLGREEGAGNSVIRLGHLSHAAAHSLRMSSGLLVTSVGNIQLPLHAVAARGKNLTGLLVLSGDESHGSILIDGKKIQGDAKKGLKVTYGSHVLVQQNAQGDVVCRERFKILPFQTLAIKLSDNIQGGK